MKSAYHLLTVLCLTGVLLLPCGCSHSNDYEQVGAGFIGILAPQPPTFLTGPSSVLLTNGPGYSARLDVQTDAILERDRLLSGQLLCRGSRLFFAPDSKGKGRSGGFSFLWDTSSNSGYVLSEALQGYAPVTGGPRAANIITTGLQQSPEDISGHLCSASQVKVQLETGASAAFEVMRAPDLGNIALRVRAATNEVPLIITLSKVQPKPPEAEIFSVPDGFTRYATPQAMADEIVAREHNLRRKTPELSPLEPQPYNPAMTPGMVPQY